MGSREAFICFFLPFLNKRDCSLCKCKREGTRGDREDVGRRKMGKAKSVKWGQGRAHTGDSRALPWLLPHFSSGTQMWLGWGG